MSDQAHTGRCECGSVRYVVRAPLRDVWACHCSQCRRISGHHVAATGAPASAVEFTADTTLKWYQSSPSAERGFCSRCGSNLFWRQLEPKSPDISIMAGSLDLPTGLKVIKHIFVADKSDYYEISDGAPQCPQWP